MYQKKMPKVLLIEMLYVTLVLIGMKNRHGWENRILAMKMDVI